MIDYERFFIFSKALSVFIQNYSICVCINFAINFLALQSCDLSDSRHHIFTAPTCVASALPPSLHHVHVYIYNSSVRAVSVMEMNRTVRPADLVNSPLYLLVFLNEE